MNGTTVRATKFIFYGNVLTPKFPKPDPMFPRTYPIGSNIVGVMAIISYIKYIFYLFLTALQYYFNLLIPIQDNALIKLSLAIIMPI